MYCRNCGKYMESTDDFCMECKAAMFDKMQAQMKAQPAQPAQENPFAQQAQARSAQENPFMQSTSVPPVQQVQNPFAPPVAQVYAQDPFAPTDAGGKRKNPRMLGFGRALTAAILSVVGLVFAMLALEFAVYSAEDAIAAYVMSAPAVILPIIFGSLSIVLAKRVKRQTDKMPIPTLVLGIVGLGYGGLAAFFDFITLMILVTA